jgi:hypothetical protein
LSNSRKSVDDGDLGDDVFISSREDEIRRAAFSLYEARNGQNGSELDDWLQAERQLLEQSTELLGAA